MHKSNETAENQNKDQSNEEEKAAYMPPVKDQIITYLPQSYHQYSDKNIIKDLNKDPEDIKLDQKTSVARTNRFADSMKRGLVPSN